jgi:hypothetical protein
LRLDRLLVHVFPRFDEATAIQDERSKKKPSGMIRTACRAPPEGNPRARKSVLNFNVRSDGKNFAQEAARLKRNRFLTLTAAIWHENRRTDIQAAMKATL